MSVWIVKSLLWSRDTYCSLFYETEHTSHIFPLSGLLFDSCTPSTCPPLVRPVRLKFQSALEHWQITWVLLLSHIFVNSQILHDQLIFLSSIQHWQCRIKPVSNMKRIYRRYRPCTSVVKVWQVYLVGICLKHGGFYLHAWSNYYQAARETVASMSLWI